MCISAYFFVYTHQIFPTKLNPRSSDRGTKEAIALHTLWNSWKCFAFPADLFALFKTERVDRKQSRENIFQYPVYVSFLTNTRFNIHFLYNLHFFGMAFFFSLLFVSMSSGHSKRLFLRLLPERFALPTLMDARACTCPPPTRTWQCTGCIESTDDSITLQYLSLWYTVQRFSVCPLFSPRIDHFRRVIVFGIGI